jgi:hypothetical protein
VFIILLFATTIECAAGRSTVDFAHHCAFALYTYLAELNGRVSTRRSQDSRRRTSRHDTTTIHIAARDKRIAGNGLVSVLIHLRWQDGRRSKGWFLGGRCRGGSSSSAHCLFRRRQHCFPLRILIVVGFLGFGHLSLRVVWHSKQGSIRGESVDFKWCIRTFEALVQSRLEYAALQNDDIVPMTGVGETSSTAGSVFGFCGRRPNVSEDCPPDGARTREVVRLCKKESRRFMVKNHAQ